MSTPPTPDQRDAMVEVDRLLAKVAYSWGVDQIDEARGILRRALMYAWYDGQSAAWNASRHIGEPRQNPWLRSTK